MTRLKLIYTIASVARPEYGMAHTVHTDDGGPGRCVIEDRGLYVACTVGNKTLLVPWSNIRCAEVL